MNDSYYDSSSKKYKEKISSTNCHQSIITTRTILYYYCAIVQGFNDICVVECDELEMMNGARELRARNSGKKRWFLRKEAYR